MTRACKPYIPLGQWGGGLMQIITTAPPLTITNSLLYHTGGKAICVVGKGNHLI